MEKAFRLLEDVAPLEEGLRNYLESAFEIRDVPKGVILVREDEICRSLGFIEKGLIRAYSFRKNGAEETYYFMKEGDVYTSVLSFFKQKKADEFVETLEPCRIISLRYDRYMHACKTYKSFHEYRAELLEKYYLLSLEREKMLQKKGFERFCYLWDHFPGLLDRVMDKHIASFLGITPEYFSTVKEGYILRAKHIRR